MVTNEYEYGWPVRDELVMILTTSGDIRFTSGNTNDFMRARAMGY